MMIENIIFVVAGTLTALIAGLLYAYTCSVNLGLGRLKDEEYLKAMQSINAAIVNPLFMLSFLGAPIFLLLAMFLNFSQLGRFTFLLAAFIVYIIGVLGITFARNVPLNNRLAEFDISSASLEEIAKTRVWYEKPWNRWHTIRTIAATIAVALIFIACL